MSTSDEARSDHGDVVFLGSNALSPDIAEAPCAGSQLGSTKDPTAGQGTSSLALRPADGEQSRGEWELEVADDDSDVRFIGQLSLEMVVAMPFRYR